MNWYCLHTKPLKEAQVAAYCSETLGLDIYYPRLRQHRTIRRQRKIVTGPLFPRYLFCRFDLGIYYRAVRYAPDMLDLVHAGSHPAIVSDELIDELRRWAGDALDVITIRPSLHAGDIVEVVDGPMRGLSATILHASDERDRVAILLSIATANCRLAKDRIAAISECFPTSCHASYPRGKI